MKPLVLIVEDEAPLVTLLRYNLEKEGFSVCAAADGEEALLQIAESKPDAVLLDWMLPLVSGLEVCRQIRRAPQSRSLPIILLTARGEPAGSAGGRRGDAALCGCRDGPRRASRLARRPGGAFGADRIPPAAPF